MCKQCNDFSDSDCTACFSGKYLINAECVELCPSHYYEDFSDSQCKMCHSSCLNCTGPLDANCTSCPSPGRFYFDLHCLGQCPDSWFGNTTTSECQSCHIHCATCQTGPAFNQCTSCNVSSSLEAVGVNSTTNETIYATVETARFLSGTTCVTHCPDGFYGNSSEHVCASCNASLCQNCVGPMEDNCTSCASPKFLYNQK